MLSKIDQDELERLQTLADGRMVDGKPKPGYKKNAALIQRRIAELRKKDGQSFQITSQ